MQGKVEICGVNTAKLKVLSQKEMDILLHRCKAGDEQARQELIEGNLRLVLSVIQRFDRRGESPTICFRWDASVSSRLSPILTRTSRCGFPLTESP